MKYKILATRWIGSSRELLGVIAFEPEPKQEEWLATIGIVDDTYSEEYAAQDIAGRGAKLLPQGAHEFFPKLDIKKYKHQ